MSASVNWYFGYIDEQLGETSIQEYLHKIGYGNEDLSGDFSSYWMESSLKISPIEQVELLTALHNNQFDFAPENINAVKILSAFFIGKQKLLRKNRNRTCRRSRCKWLVCGLT